MSELQCYKNDDDEKASPPKTFDDYMILNCLSEWPHRITSENIPELKESVKDFASEESILNMLKAVITVNYDPLKELSAKFAVFEGELATITDKLLDVPDDIILSLADNTAEKSEKSPEESQETGRDVVTRLKQLEFRAVQYCQVPGFNATEMNPLPGNLESRQILNNVLTLQPFAPTMTLFWKKILLSEASLAMLHDTFWWTFIDQFQPSRTLERNKLFDRLSDTFVSLCYSIGASVKDKVLLTFSDCLAQSVYAVFARAFPASLHSFDAKFKQNLINNTQEWISGLQPPAGSWLKWNLPALELQDQRTDSEVAELSLVISGGIWQTPDFAGTYRAVQSIGVGVFSNDTPDEPSTLDCFPAKFTNSDKTSTNELNQSTFIVKSKESHPVGQGAELERVLFALKGRSVLVSHFLKMRQLQAKEFHSAKVHHTRVKKLPAPDELTYNQLLQNVWQKHLDSKKKHFNRIDHIQTATEERIAKLQSALSAGSSMNNLSDLIDDESV